MAARGSPNQPVDTTNVNSLHPDLALAHRTPLRRDVQLSGGHLHLQGACRLSTMPSLPCACDVHRVEYGTILFITVENEDHLNTRLRPVLQVVTLSNIVLYDTQQCFIVARPVDFICCYWIRQGSAAGKEGERPIALSLLRINDYFGNLRPSSGELGRLCPRGYLKVAQGLWLA